MFVMKKMKHLYQMRSVNRESLFQRRLQDPALAGILSKLHILGAEFCYNIELSPGITTLSSDDMSILEFFIRDQILLEGMEGSELIQWEKSVLEELVEKENISHQHNYEFLHIFEIGPRLTFTTPWCSNMLSMLRDCGVENIERIEQNKRYLFNLSIAMSEEEKQIIAKLLHDPMTECIYSSSLQSFIDHTIEPEPTHRIQLLEEGRKALEDANQQMGLGFDEQDLQFYYQLFVDQLQRNPTDVELFDLGQSNSEHSRHWFFNGQLVIDGKAIPLTLFEIVKSTLPQTSNSIIAFHDNSSAIMGYDVQTMQSTNPTTASPMMSKSQLLHPVLTAETHNFPCAIAPFPGAETGTGGRIRDVQATGRGAFTIAGIAAYCVGNLNIPGNCLPWENAYEVVPNNLATPLDILIQASNGASDYGKF